MSGPRAEAGAQGEADALGDELDVDQLLALAREYRAGSEARPRDLRACFETYKRAAQLGSVEATYAVALFLMSGGAVPQDLKAGAEQLRAAADAGHVPAKMYLANMYDLGIFYAKDAEKADVWYRNVARASDIRDVIGSPEYRRRMAELGSARDFFILAESGTLDEEARENLRRRARMLGLDLKVAAPPAPGAPILTPGTMQGYKPGNESTPQTTAVVTPPQGMPAGSLEASQATGTGPSKAAAQAAAAQANAAQASKAKAASAKNKAARAKRAASPWTVSAGLTAFALAAIFIVVGLALGYGLTVAAVAPGISVRIPAHFGPWIVPATFGLVSVLPQILMYRIEALIKSIVLGGAFAATGFVVWRAGLLANVPVLGSMSLIVSLSYASAVGLAFGLLLLGVHGGVRVKKLR